MFVTDVGKDLKKGTKKKAPGTMIFCANYFSIFDFGHLFYVQILYRLSFTDSKKTEKKKFPS